MRRYHHHRPDKGRQVWWEACAELEAAGFEETANCFTRMVIDKDGPRVEELTTTGPHGSWIAIIQRDGRRRALRGPKKGLRTFKTATACLEALEREMGTWEVVAGPFCPEHAPKIRVDKS